MNKCCQRFCLYYSVPSGQLQLYISAEGSPIAGQTYNLTCDVILPVGMTAPVLVQWQNSDGAVSSGSGLTVGETMESGSNLSLSLQFSPLRLSHGQRFICNATTMLATPPYLLHGQAEFEFIVEGMCMSIAPLAHAVLQCGRKSAKWFGGGGGC